ncbi:MAG: JAB domain-containing protein [Mycoplasmatales bacterium]|nr:JAB domain-containing protein [Mycoplasmatales bacterium]
MYRARRYFHNHPSGNLNPSKNDLKITKRLKYYCDLFGIKLEGHLIINSNGEFIVIR